MRPYLELHFELSRILHFKYVRFRFGRLPVGYYQKLKEYLQEDDCTIFEKCRVDESYVWGIYFVPVSEAKKADAIYASMHFERIFIEDAYPGTVDEACRALEQETEALEGQIRQLDDDLEARLKEDADRLLAAREVIEKQSARFDIRRLAAFTRSKNETFFILCGWMAKKDAVRLGKELEADPELFVTLEENPDRRTSVPPTRLKNPALIRPFEMFVRMYGLPNYNEFDPTLFAGAHLFHHLRSHVRRCGTGPVPGSGRIPAVPLQKSEPGGHPFLLRHFFHPVRVPLWKPVRL